MKDFDIIHLLKYKSFKDLTEWERSKVLTAMTAEEYDIEHQIVQLTEGVKKSQKNILPNPLLKTELLERMVTNTPTKVVWVRYIYKVAAVLLLAISFVFYFRSTREMIKLSKQNTYTEIMPVIDTILVLNKEFNTNTLKPKVKHHLNIKKSRKAAFKKPNDCDYSDILMTFNRVNTNMQWQADEDDKIPINDMPKISLNDE